MADVINLGVEHIAPSQLPPNAPELEQAVIGACMLERSALAEVVELLNPKVFYVAAHMHLWAAIGGLHAQRAPVDILTVTQECKRRGTLDTIGGVFYISQLTNKVSSGGNIVYHAHLILQCFIGREAIRIGNELVQGGYHPGTDVFDMLAGVGSEIRLLNEFGVKQARTMAEIMPEVVDNKSTDRGVRTGFDSIDSKMRLEPGTVTIIGARPAMGKTAFMLSSAWRQAKAGHRPYLVEMEMRDSNLATRLACGECRIPVWKAKRRQMDGQDVDTLAQWHIAQGEPLSRLTVDETASMRVSALAARLDRAKRKEGTDVVWIDYIGLLQPSEKQRPGYDRMTAISNELRVLAKEIDLPFAVLAQLSRPPKGSTVTAPKLTDLRDSGEIEQDAECVAFIHRPKYYDASADETVQFIIAKNRDGEDGLAEMDFDGQGIRMVDKGGAYAAAPKYDPKAGLPSPDNRTEPKKDTDDVAPF